MAVVIGITRVKTTAMVQVRIAWILAVPPGLVSITIFPPLAVVAGPTVMAAPVGIIVLRATKAATPAAFFRAQAGIAPVPIAHARVVIRIPVFRITATKGKVAIVPVALLIMRTLGLLSPVITDVGTGTVIIPAIRAATGSLTIIVAAHAGNAAAGNVTFVIEPATRLDRIVIRAAVAAVAILSILVVAVVASVLV